MPSIQKPDANPNMAMNTEADGAIVSPEQAKLNFERVTGITLQTDHCVPSQLNERAECSSDDWLYNCWWMAQNVFTGLSQRDFHDRHDNVNCIGIASAESDVYQDEDFLQEFVGVDEIVHDVENTIILGDHDQMYHANTLRVLRHCSTPQHTTERCKLYGNNSICAVYGQVYLDDGRVDNGLYASIPTNLLRGLMGDDDAPCDTVVTQIVAYSQEQHDGTKKQHTPHCTSVSHIMTVVFDNRRRNICLLDSNGPANEVALGWTACAVAALALIGKINERLTTDRPPWTISVPGTYTCQRLVNNFMLGTCVAWSEIAWQMHAVLGGDEAEATLRALAGSSQTMQPNTDELHANDVVRSYMLARLAIMSGRYIGVKYDPYNTVMTFANGRRVVGIKHRRILRDGGDGTLYHNRGLLRNQLCSFYMGDMWQVEVVPVHHVDRVVRDDGRDWAVSIKVLRNGNTDEITRVQQEIDGMLPETVLAMNMQDGQHAGLIAAVLMAHFVKEIERGDTQEYKLTGRLSRHLMVGMLKQQLEVAQTLAEMMGPIRNHTGHGNNGLF